MARLGFLSLFLAVALGASAASAAEPVIGSVTHAIGASTGVSEGVSRSLAGGALVHLNESVSTGEKSRVEITFEDETRLIVGSNSRVVLDEFVFRPAGESRFHATISGPFRYISGKLAAGGARQASIETPFAVLGVRGTDFWGGPIDGVSGVIVFEGAVSVTTAAGTVVLSRAGEGTDVTGPNAPPGDVTNWSKEKIASALATVAIP